MGITMAITFIGWDIPTIMEGSGIAPPKYQKDRKVESYPDSDRLLFDLF